MSEVPSVVEVCKAISVIQNNRSNAYKRYLDEMPEEYLEEFMDYLLDSPEEDVTHSEYLFNNDHIIGIGFYKPESPKLTSIHKIIYFEEPSYECMSGFLKKIIDGREKPHSVVWTFKGESCLEAIGNSLCKTYRGYIETFPNRSIAHFTVNK